MKVQNLDSLEKTDIVPADDDKDTSLCWLGYYGKSGNKRGINRQINIIMFDAVMK